MELFRKVADSGPAVLATTHSMNSLELCDGLWVLVRGQTAYLGPPSHALEYFRVEDWDAIFTQIPKQSPSAWAASCLRDPVCKQFMRRATK